MSRSARFALRHPFVDRILDRGDTLTVATGDFDGNGAPDLATGYPNGAGARIWLNNGNGRFTDSGQQLGGGNIAALVHPDHHQHTELLVLRPQATVDAIRPQIDPAVTTHIPPVPVGVFRFPSSLQTADHRGRQPPRLRPNQRLLHLPRGHPLQVQPWQGRFHTLGPST